MARQAPKRASSPKAAPKAVAKAEVQPAPKVAAKVATAKTSTYQMLRSGAAEGASGIKYSFSVGDLIETPAGELDHLGSRYCVKK